MTALKLVEKNLPEVLRRRKNSKLIEIPSVAALTKRKPLFQSVSFKLNLRRKV